MYLRIMCPLSNTEGSQTGGSSRVVIFHIVRAFRQVSLQMERTSTMIQLGVWVGR